MGADQALSLLSHMLWTAALISAPVLISILLVGVIISVIQVATQIQEMTLTYVPKLVLTGLMLIFLGSWMMGILSQFSTELFNSIPSLSR